MKKSKLGVFAPVLVSLLLTGCGKRPTNVQPPAPVVTTINNVKDYNKMLTAVIYDEIDTVTFLEEVSQKEDILIKSRTRTLQSKTDTTGAVSYTTDTTTKTRKNIDVNEGDLEEFETLTETEDSIDPSLNNYLFFNLRLDNFTLKASEVASVVSLNGEVVITPNSNLVFEIGNNDIIGKINVSSITMKLISKDFHEGLLFSDFGFVGTSTDGKYDFSYSVKVGY